MSDRGIPAGPGTPPRPRMRAVVGWVTYDLANTIFSLNIVSLYFSLWVVNVMHGRDSDYALANGASMAVIFVLSPFVGAFSDQLSRRKPLLLCATLTCVAATLVLGRVGLGLSLVVYAIANIAYQVGLQIYDALLPAVSTPENRGRIGGIGIGLGYVGAIVGLVVGRALLGDVDALAPDAATGRYVLVFGASALLFLAFSTPLFAWVEEHPRRGARRSAPTGAGATPSTPPGAPRARHALRDAIEAALETLRHARGHPGLVRFLVGRAFYTDAVNTVIAFMGIYVTTAVGFTSAESQIVLLVAIVCAALGGFLWGRIVDLAGPHRTLRLVLVLWIGVFAWAASVGLFALPPAWFWPVPALAGIALGGTWVADRPLMLGLAPADRIGEFFGLYGMVGRFSAITGPLLWAFVAETLGLGRPAAVLTLLGFVIVATAILWTPFTTLPARDGS